MHPFSSSGLNNNDYLFQMPTYRHIQNDDWKVNVFTLSPKKLHKTDIDHWKKNSDTIKLTVPCNE